MMHYVILNLEDNENYTPLKQHLREKVLNWVELNDLTYHAKVLKML